MTKTTVRGHRRRRVGLEIGPERLVLRGCSEAAVAIVIDGEVRATLSVVAGEAAWALPHDVFGRLLDVIGTASGVSLLAAPVAFEAHRSLRWQGWSRQGRIVAVRFEVLGPAAPPALLPIAVALMAGGVRFGQGFAEAGRGFAEAGLGFAEAGRGFAEAGRGGYAGRIVLDRLPPDGRGLRLSPVIGGRALPEAIEVPADAFEHIGYVDQVVPRAARGWVVRRGDMAERVTVGLWLDGRRVATARADIMRADVAAEGIGDGRSGFDIPFPGYVPLDRPVLVDVRVVAGSTGGGETGGPSLSHSPYLQPAAAFVGHVDRIELGYAGGWAFDARSSAPVSVEAVCDGVVVGRAVADIYRDDVLAAGLPVARCGFQISMTGASERLLGREVAIRVAGTEHVLPGSPRRVTASPVLAAFLGRSQALPAPVLTRLRRTLSHRTRGLTVSLIMPVFETRRDWLVEAIQSVQAQWSAQWELICVDDGSRAPHVAETLAGFARADRRIRVLRSAQNFGTAAAVNFGLRAATGDYVAVLDHDDALEPDAVYHLARAALQTRADLLYSDEAVTGATLDQLVELRARPVFSHDYYLSHPYFVHLVAVRASLARALGGYDEAMPISADVDFVLRAIERTGERAGAIGHVARVLYRWRTHAGSAGHRRGDEVMAATQGAIERHLARLGQGAAVRPGVGFNQFRLDWPDDGGEVLIVIPTRDRVDLLRTCIESVERTTRGERCRIVVIDHESQQAETRRYLRRIAGRHTVMPFSGPFNYARMNNEAVRLHAGAAPYLLFLNNDVEARAPGWLGRLRSLARRPDVGAVGPMLLYGDGRVQHAGVVVGFGGGADHAMRFAHRQEPSGEPNAGYNTSLTSVRDYSAVTAACLMMRRDAFERVDGFDEDFPVGYNDTDLCLRLREAGYAVLYDGQTALTHHESATRAQDRSLAGHAADDARLRARWPRYFAAGDPYYSPLLSQSGRDHQIADALPDKRLPAYRSVVAPDWLCRKPR